jgi:hypothetical protein
MSYNTIVKFILYNALYIPSKFTAVFQKFGDNGSDHQKKKYAFYEHVAEPAKEMPFPAQADGFAGFKITEPGVNWRIVYDKNKVILSKARWGPEDGLFGARYHEIKTQDRYDNSENARDPSIPGITVSIRDDGSVVGSQYIPNSFRGLRLEMDKESEVKFYCFVLESEEDRKTIKGPSVITFGQHDHNDKIRIK